MFAAVSLMTIDATLLFARTVTASPASTSVRTNVYAPAIFPKTPLTVNNCASFKTIGLVSEIVILLIFMPVSATLDIFD